MDIKKHPLKTMDVIDDACPQFNGGLAELPVKLGMDE